MFSLFLIASVLIACTLRAPRPVPVRVAPARR